MKKHLLSFILMSVVVITASAQCTETYVGTNPFGPAQTGYLAGQSFTAPCSGLLNYVQVTAATGGTIPSGTLSIYAGNGTGTIPIYTQAHAAITVPAGGGPVQIMITGSVPITNASQYTFEMFMTLDMDVDITYPGGDAFQSGTNVGPVDASFEADITIATGIAEETTSEISIFPNPATNVINIKTVDQIETVTIYSITGALVKTGSQSTINIAELSKGMYILAVKTDKGITRTRFTKA